MLAEKEINEIYKISCKYIVNKYEKNREALLNNIYDKKDLKQEAYIILQNQLKNNNIPEGYEIPPSKMDSKHFLKWYKTCLSNFVSDLIKHSNVKTKHFENNILDTDEDNLELDHPEGSYQNASIDPFSTRQKYNIRDIFYRLEPQEAKILKLYILQNKTQQQTYNSTLNQTEFLKLKCTEFNNGTIDNT